MSIAQDNLNALFGFLGRDDLNLQDVVERYVNYHGSLYHGHRLLLIRQLRNAAAVLDASVAAQCADHEIVHDDGRIATEFLQRFASGFVGAFYDEAPWVNFTRKTILAASVNEWCSTDLPAPFNIRLGKAKRPAVDILFGQGHSLFVSPYGYQRFDPVAGRAWPAASSRAFPRSIEGHGSIAVDTPVAVIQDSFDGTNFAHFLYDCVPRVMHLARQFPDFARRCVFLMGGEPGPFHELVLGWICARHDLAPAQFVFPRHSAIWRLSGEAAFFSDQTEVATHPLHMCHPLTTRMVRDLLDPSLLPTDTPERIYISRQDAPGRRVLNEPELMAALADRGYVPVRRSEFDAAAQIGLLAQARHVVAPHGMGLSNLLFNQPGGSLVEIFNPRLGTDAFAFVARSLGMDYRFSIGADRDDGAHGTVADVEHVMSLVTALDPGSAARYKVPASIGSGTTKEEAIAAPVQDPPARDDARAVMVSEADLTQQFESLGDNCEFGLVQRYVGAEPLGFFRFNYLHRGALIGMLDTEFRDADRPEDIELRRATPAADAELIVHNRRYHYNYHTFRHDADADKVRTQQLRVVSFLKEKLLADLRAGEKIFIRKGDQSPHEAVELLQRLRRFGPAILLWVVPEDEGNVAGTVRVLQPGLLQGFLDRFAPPTDAYDLSPAWLPMLRNAHALRVGGCAPGTVIVPPRERRVTNLLRREYIFPRTANWWVGANSIVAEGGEGAPSRVHPASLVTEHRLTTDTVQAISPICGITLRHGLTAGAPYVASMDVWVPEGVALAQVGAVFNGLPATQVRIADLTRRNIWQRVWVAARAAADGRVNPSLFMVGKEGARLYSTAWQMEIGHTPSPYVSSLTGILNNRGPDPGSFRQLRAG